MMKISSATHINIILVFSVLFIGFYLYYAITDFRKLTIEVKGIQTSMKAISNDVAEIQKTNMDITKLFNMNEMLSSELNTMLAQNQSPHTNPVIPRVAQPTICEVTEANVCKLDVKDKKDVADDTESVDTADIKKMIADEDEDEEDEEDDDVVCSETKQI